LSAVSFEELNINGWDLSITGRQKLKSDGTAEAVYHGVLTGLRGAVAVAPKEKRSFGSRQALLEFWEPVARGLPIPLVMRWRVLGVCEECGGYGQVEVPGTGAGDRDAKDCPVCTKPEDPLPAPVP
jgi:hypothetical protein